MSETNETFVSGFFNSVDDDRTYNAIHFANYFGALVSDGVFPNPSTNMQVLAHTGMKVKISKGMAWIKAYFAHNMADYILNVEPADGTLKRIDRIVLRLDLNSRLIKPELIKGKFATSPVAPTLVRNDEVHDIALADIYVANGTTAINQGMITDQRLNNNLCGIVHALINQVDTTTIFNQYQSWFDNYTVTKAAEFETWQKNVTTALEQWIVAQKEGFDAWKAAEKELYYAWLQGQKNGFDTWFATIKDILDTNAAGNLQLQMDAHKDAMLPHKYLDTSDNKVYQWGMQKNSALNTTAFMYAEPESEFVNKINLPTYEQLLEVLADLDSLPAINTNVNNVNTNVNAVKTTTNTINTNLGTPNSSASNGVTANAHAKLNWLLTNISTLIASRSIKRVQSGAVNYTQTYDNLNGLVIPISYVADLTKAFCIVNGKFLAIYSTTVAEFDLATDFKLTNSTIEMRTNLANSGMNRSTCKMGWQVIEFY